MSESEGGRVVRQLRHDVDDVYELLNTVQQTLTTRSDNQDARLDRIEATQAQQNDRLERIDGRLDQILTLLRGSQ
jgi:hypothetical protein